MSSDTSSMPNIEEYIASISDQNRLDYYSILNVTPSCDDDCSSDEIEIIKELKVNLDKHECALCSEGTFLVNRLLEFGGVLNDVHKFACDICNTGFKTKADVNKHKKLHEDGVLSDDPGFHSLLNISNSYENGVAAQPSSSRRRKTSSAPVVCDVCCKILKSEKTLETHKRNQHSNITYTCEVCDAKFTKFHQFKKHCKNHTISEELYTCPACNKQFMYESTFKKHVCSLN